MEQTKPIRILHVVTQMARGGLETMLMNYYRNIDRRIVQFDFLEHRDFVTDYDSEILQLGGKIYRVPRLNPVDPHYLRALDLFFREHRDYRIVHVHLDCMSGIPLKYAEKYGVEVRIAHAHSTSEIKNFRYPVKLALKRTIPVYATDLFACGEKAGKWMFGQKEFSILNNAIDAEKFSFNETVRHEARAEFGIDSGTLVVGHVGNFGYPKNHSFLIDAFSLLIEKREKCKLLLVGKGSLENEIREKCIALGLIDKVIFAGLRNDVNRLLQAMDVFVFPSFYEGVSLVSIEAQAAGLPCVFSENISEECIVTDGLVNQLPLGDADIWADEILFAEKKNRQNTLTVIRQSGFDVKQNAEHLQNYYLQKWNSCYDGKRLR